MQNNISTNICNKVTAIGTILPNSILRYEDECAPWEESGSEAHSITEFQLSVKHSIEGTEKESVILCRATNPLVECLCEDLQAGDRISLSGKLDLGSPSSIDLMEVSLLKEDPSQPDFLKGSFTGWVRSSPHLFFSDPAHPVATYELEVETEQEYSYLIVPCHVSGELSRVVETDFHYGASVTVEGNLHTVLHQELTPTAYDIYHTEPSMEDMAITYDENQNPVLRAKVSVHVPELSVTSNALTKEGQTQKNRELACFQKYLQQKGL